MEDGRYDMTLEDVPEVILSVRQSGVPIGLTATHTEPGFLLSDGTALLHDKLLGTTADISSNGYSFYSGATDGTDFNRFELSFEPTGQTPTAIDGTPDGTEAAVTGAEGYICVSGEAGAAVSIWAADGRTLHSGKLGTTPLRINLPAGIYVVGINGRTQKTIVY